MEMSAFVDHFPAKTHGNIHTFPSICMSEAKHRDRARHRSSWASSVWQALGKHGANVQARNPWQVSGKHGKSPWTCSFQHPSTNSLMVYFSFNQFFDGVFLGMFSVCSAGLWFQPSFSRGEELCAVFRTLVIYCIALMRWWMLYFLSGASTIIAAVRLQIARRYGLANKEESTNI